MPRVSNFTSGACQYNLPTPDALPVISVDQKNFRETLVTLHQVSAEAQDGSLLIWSSGNDPHLETVLLDLDPLFLHVLQIHLRVPQDTMTQVFYQRKHRKLYTEADSDRIDCRKGDNLITIILNDADSLTCIRLDPGTLVGKYILKEFSIFREWQFNAHPTLVCHQDPRKTVLWNKIRAFAENTYETTRHPWSLFYWILFWICVVRYKFSGIIQKSAVFWNCQKTRVGCNNRDMSWRKTSPKLEQMSHKMILRGFLTSKPVTFVLCGLVALLTILLVLGMSLRYFGYRTSQDLKAITHESGYCFLSSVNNSTNHWYWILTGRPDANDAPQASRLILYENDKPLGHPHSLHESIRVHGNGRYSHWGETLYFSSSENSDPRYNGRNYRVEYPLFLRLRVLSIILTAWAVAVAACLIIFRQAIIVPRTVYTGLRDNSVVNWLWQGLLLAGICVVVFYRGYLDIPPTLNNIAGAAVLILGFWLIFRQRPAVAAWAGVAATLILFFLALFSLWRSGHYDGVLIAGLLPWSDANGYYWDALGLLNGVQFSSFSSRRPLYAGLLSLLLGLTDYNLQIVLIIQCIIVAISCFLLAYEIRKMAGPIAAALVLVILIYCYVGYGFVGRTLTENLGLSLGSLALAILLRGASSNRLPLIALGIIGLTLALNARAGAFFVLPALVAWSAIYYRRQSWLSPRHLIVATGAVMIGFALNFLLLKVVGSSQGTIHSNFSYVLYGLASGYKGWAQVTIDYPTAGPERIYELAMALILESPSTFAAAILKAYQEYFRPDVMFRFLFFSGEDQLKAGYILAGLSVVSLGRMVITFRNPVSSMMLALMAGVVASIGFVPPIDADGGRALTATIPITGVFAAFALARFAKPEYISSIHKRTFWQAILVPFSIFLAGTCVFGPVLIKAFSRPPEKLISLSCPTGYESLTLRVAKGSYVNIVDDDSQNQSWLPNLRIGDLRFALAGKESSYPELHRALIDLKAGESVLLAPNLQNYRIEGKEYPTWLITRTSAIQKIGGLNNFCARPSESEWLRRYRFYYDESVDRQ